MVFGPVGNDQVATLEDLNGREFFVLALLAAVQPAQTQALYFVARGDGSSQFSATLDEHNRAVDKYIRGR